MANPAIEEKVKSFRDYVKKIKSYEEAIGVLYWDMRTGAPRKGIGTRSETVGLLSEEMFKMTVSPQMGSYVKELSAPDVMAQLDPVNRKLVEECKKEYERNRKIPPERFREYVTLTSQAEAEWEVAKEERDFSRFRPYLEKIVDFNREFVELWGYAENPYDALLDIYEPGMTVRKLDEVFAKLKMKLVELVSAVQSCGRHPDTSFLRQHYPKEKQRDFCLFLLREMGYDFDAGRMDESVHPFATGLNIGDVRITTKFVENDLACSIFSVIHEGGHALYEQKISPELNGTLLCTGTSMGIHESQSRLWENMIGRSREFWNRYFPDLKARFPEALGQVSVEAFYRAINHASPSLIRIDADELTYNLHILIRYELEKSLFNGEIQVSQLPEAWNEKYREYLGVVPKHDGEGVLQDVHWSGGSFGYFPSYALGNLYAAQIMHAMEKAMPNLKSLVENGEFAQPVQWLTDHIYRYGKLKDPGDIIREATGEDLNPDYFIRYIESKFRDIYEF